MKFTRGQQIYIERGRYCRRHAKFLGPVPMCDGFCIVQLYTLTGEISCDRDVVPASHIRPVTEHATL